MYHEKSIIKNLYPACRKDVGINRKTNPANRYRRIHYFTPVGSLLLLYRMGRRNGHDIASGRYSGVLFLCHIMVDLKRLLQYIQ